MKKDSKDRKFDDMGRYNPGRPVFREFVTTINTADFSRHAGIGLTLEEVIGNHLESYRDAWDSWQETYDDLPESEAAESWIRRSEDMVVWEGSKVVAVLRGTVATLPRYEVIKFDLPS